MYNACIDCLCCFGEGGERRCGERVVKLASYRHAAILTESELHCGLTNIQKEREKIKKGK